MTDRRTHLLDEATAYMIDNGVAKLSLRPLAAELGTSARMLVYHFGSKDELIIAVVSEVRARFQAALERAFARPRSPAGHPLLRFWETLIEPANLGYARLLYEVQILAVQDPRAWGRYLEQTSTSWLEAIERTLRPALRSRTTATLCQAVVDGLLLDVLSTGERERATEALLAFLERLTENPSSPVGSEDACDPEEVTRD